jgi:hypothetical protein
VHPRNSRRLRLRPHLLEVLDDHHVGVHVAVDTVLHASILASGKGALRQAAGDALLEADGVEFVNGCRPGLAREGVKRRACAGLAAHACGDEGLDILD